jgi:hypothetical protein
MMLMLFCVCFLLFVWVLDFQFCSQASSLLGLSVGAHAVGAHSNFTNTELSISYKSSVCTQARRGEQG